MVPAAHNPRTQGKRFKAELVPPMTRPAGTQTQKKTTWTGISTHKSAMIPNVQDSNNVLNAVGPVGSA
jgi:hypothetical protein